MSRFTINPTLRKEKKNQKGLCPVVLVIHYNGKRWNEPLEFSIPETAWDMAKSRVKPMVANAGALNSKIQTAVVQMEANILRAIETDQPPRRLKETDVMPATSFYEYAEGIFAAMDAKGQAVTTRRYRNNIPSIKAYAGESLALKEITPTWLQGYELFSKNQVRSRTKDDTAKISPNTIWSRFKMLRKIMKQAEKEELIGQCPIGSHKGGYPAPDWTAVPKDYLTYGEVEKLAAMLGHAGFTEAEDTVLSFFLIECTAGIRHSDWSRFTIEKLVDGEALKVQQTKKTGAPIYVPIQPGTMLARTIAHINEKGYKYEATESAYANRALKVIAKVAGISKPMTTHTGRHTAATLLLEKGFSRESVAEVLGITIKIVDTYAKMTRQKVRNEFNKLGGI